MWNEVEALFNSSVHAVKQKQAAGTSVRIILGSSIPGKGARCLLPAFAKENIKTQLRQTDETLQKFLWGGLTTWWFHESMRSCRHWYKTHPRVEDRADGTRNKNVSHCMADLKLHAQHFSFKQLWEETVSKGRPCRRPVLRYLDLRKNRTGSPNWSSARRLTARALMVLIICRGCAPVQDGVCAQLNEFCEYQNRSYSAGRSRLLSAVKFYSDF